MLKKQHKPHTTPQAGRKAEKKKLAKQKSQGSILKKGKNPKAFNVKSYIKFRKIRQRNSDLRQKKLHDIKVNRTTEECVDPPIFIAVIGPKGSGKSTVIRSLVKHWTKHNVKEVKGPLTCVTGKKRRVTMLEVPNTLHALIDAAKVCDLALLLVDASIGFEMEHFEFLNVAQIHGFPRVMGVLTHLDKFKSAKTLRRIKKEMKHRFWQEIYQGAKLFYLSGMTNNRYLSREILNLSRFISILKFRPLTWRNAHPHVIADRYEDITDPGLVEENPKVDRKLVFYGWVRGTNFKQHQDIHFLGVGDFQVGAVEKIEDPCPLSARRKRRLDSRDRLVYAPMADVGSIMYDQDAMYVNIRHHQLNYTAPEDVVAEEGEVILPTQGEGESLVKDLQQLKFGLDEKMASSSVQIFSGGAAVSEVPEAPVERVEDAIDASTDVFARLVSDEVVDEHGRTRRRVRFADAEEQAALDAQSSDSEDGGAEKAGATSGAVSAFLDSSDGEEESELESGGEESEEKSEEEESEEKSEEEEAGDALDEWSMSNSSAWRAAIVDRARKRFTRKSLQQMVYGKSEEVEENEDESDEDEFFFVPKETKQQKRERRLITNKVLFENLEFNDWTLEENYEGLKERFVTGSWAEEEKEGSDEEDSEAEEKVDFSGTAGRDVQVEDSGLRADETEEEAVERRKLEKADMKKKFNATYDEEGPDGEDHYQQMLRERQEQTAKNIAEFANEDEETQAQLRGLIPGSYVRMEISDIPCEFVTNFDLNNPLILGGLLANERQLGFLQVRFKKHRWHRALLKHNDPLVISMGWRRYQTLPIYSMEDRNNSRYRMIKYTPEHQHCVAHFYGPIAPPGTGMIGYLRSDRKQASFRISATGTVLGINAQFEVVKKLKLTGYPYNIHKNTCFVKGMFSSDVEAARFVGAKVRTVAKLRGMIKKAHNPQGDVRCTFEDQLRKSDIVFLRSWIKVEAEKYYNPVLSLLLEDGEKWQGMRTVGQIRYDKGVATPKKEDSEYKPVDRPQQRFQPFKISNKLEASLPFKSKRKDEKKKSKSALARQKIRRIVLSKAEKRKRHLLQEMTTLTHDRRDKKRKKNAERLIYNAKTHEEDEKARGAYNKEKRKRKYVMQGLREKKRQKMRK